MIALTSSLLALAGLLAERAVWTARRATLDPRLGLRPRRKSVVVPRWLAWCGAGALALPVGGPPLALAVVAGGALTVRLLEVRRQRAERRRREDQLADAVAAIAAGIRAGLSLPLALANARDEAQPPLEGSLARLVGRVQVGTPIGEAMEAWAEEIGSDDARLIVGVLELHRRSGGDLPSVLDGLVGTLRERRAAHREVRALTAQARLSGVILGTLPVGFFVFLVLTSGREMLPAIATPLGRSALVIGVVLEAAAFLWIRRILEVR
jgi:tight adherence protein B